MYSTTTHLITVYPTCLIILAGVLLLIGEMNIARLIMLFKIIHHIVDINADDLLPPRPCIHSTGGHSKRFLQLPARTNAYSNSFLPSSIKLWNSLPDDVVIVTDLNHFKQGITGLLS